MNYYDRENNVWYDKKIINFLSQINKGRFVSMWDYFIDTNLQNFTDDINEDFDVDIEGLTIQKIIFNMIFNENFTGKDIEFSSLDINGDKYIIPMENNVRKKSTYFEPESYFTPEMLRIIEDAEKKTAGKQPNQPNGQEAADEDSEN